MDQHPSIAGGMIGLLFGAALSVGLLRDPAASRALMAEEFSGHRGQAAYADDVLPLLNAYCADCHTRGTSEGRWAFDAYANYADLLGDQSAWKKVEQLVAHHIMPPHGGEMPSVEQRRVLLGWIDQVVFHVDPSRPDPGPVTLRRLNRTEYNQTVRDILGVSGSPADQFPEDDSGYGFDNIGEVLSVSPLHVEKYFSVARQIADEVMELEPPPRVGLELTADKLTSFSGNPELLGNMRVLRSSQDVVGTTVHVPETSIYRILIRASSSRLSEEQLATIEVTRNGEPIAQLRPTMELRERPGGTSTQFVLVELPAGDHELGLRLAGKTDPSDADAVAAVAFLGISGPFTPMAPRASEYLRRATISRPLGVPLLRLSGEDLDGGSGRTSLDTGRAWFASNGYRHAPVLIRQAGEYRVRFKVGAQQVGDEPVRFEVRLGGQTIGPFPVTAEAQAEQWVETSCQFEAGQHDWQVWFVNEFEDPQTGQQRWFWLHEFTIEGPLDEDYGITRDEAVEQLLSVGRRLFRRPLSNEESTKLTAVLDSLMDTGESAHAALRFALEALLASPKFLYHATPKPIGLEEHGTAWIDEFALASRLSHFLWSSAPDDELLALAERGELRSNFAAQVTRMLDDAKSSALSRNFAGQWLQLRNLEHVAPDSRTFPEFDAELAVDMRRETELVFEHILRENRPLREFLDADYTFVNARLAQHYQLPVPGAEGFHRVSLVGTPRRGVVNHASILTITSHPTRTSPVKRGQWLLEQMLGIVPPPAPADVPPLEETREDERLSMRVRLEEHRANPACASCHALLDPPGFALEHYDPIGRWRARDGDHPVDASGRLITGESFGDWTELRGLLIRERRDELVRCLTEHLFTYALGRGITYRDKPALAEVRRRSESPNFGFRDLILAVCESVPMQRMRIDTP